MPPHCARLLIAAADGGRWPTVTPSGERERCDSGIPSTNSVFTTPAESEVMNIVFWNATHINELWGSLVGTGLIWGEKEVSEKASSHRESNPGHLAWAPSTSATELRQPDNYQPPHSSICTAQVELKCLSRTPGSHSLCVVRTPLGDWPEFSPSGESPCWVVFSA